jgi:hypothetical protein
MFYPWPQASRTYWTSPLLPLMSKKKKKKKKKTTTLSNHRWSGLIWSNLADLLWSKSCVVATFIIWWSPRLHLSCRNEIFLLDDMLSDWTLLVRFCYHVKIYIHIYYITRIRIYILFQRQLGKRIGWSTYDGSYAYHTLFILVNYSTIIVMVNMRDHFGI